MGIDKYTGRFSGAEWYREIQEMNVSIIGCGGIGSNAAYYMGKMFPKLIMLYDGDEASPENMAGQMFFEKAALERWKKTDIMEEMLMTLCGNPKVAAYGYYIDRETDGFYDMGNICICGVDSMSARKQVYTAWKKSSKAKAAVNKNFRSLFLDGRLAAETWQVLSVEYGNSLQDACYSSSYLFDDSKAEDTPCSYKQTAFAAGQIASYIASLAVNWAYNNVQSNKDIQRPVPFFTQYDSRYMLFDTEEAQ